ncbi:MAG: hypothetical protein AMXMBFR64_34030 [Myxococcales bacterium]
MAGVTRRLVSVALGAALSLAAASGRAVPTQIPYRGDLTYSDGTPYDGEVTLSVALYASETGGAPVWGPSEYTEVEVESGALEVVMGAPPGPPLDASLLPPGGLWIELAVDGTTLEPRQRVLSAAYALLAGDAERLGGEDASAFATHDDVAAQGFLTPAAVGAVALSGAYADLMDAPDLGAYLRADGTTPLAGPWSLGGHSLSGVVIGGGPVPLGAAAGQLWWDSGAAVMKIYNGTAWLPVSGEAGGGGIASALQCSGCVDEGALSFALAAVAKSGAYADLAGAPVLASVATSGAYADLSGAPSLDAYATKASLASVATSGAYADLSGAPSLDAYATKASLASVATSGAYVDLSGAPDPAAFALVSDVAPVCWSGNWADLSGAPDLAAYLRADGSVALTGDLDVAGHRLVAAAVDSGPSPPPGPAKGQLWYDTGTSRLRVWSGVAWGSAGGEGGSTDLPPDGLEAVSNGTLSNLIDRSWPAPGLPAPIGESVEATILVTDKGVLRDITLFVAVTHPFVPELEVRLFPPGGSDSFLLLPPNGAMGSSVNLTVTQSTLLPGGMTLGLLLESEQQGPWVVRVTDTVINGNEGPGQLVSASLALRFLSDSEVAVPGKLAVSGTVGVSGALDVSGTLMVNAVRDSAFCDGTNNGALWMDPTDWTLHACVAKEKVAIYSSVATQQWAPNRKHYVFTTSATYSGDLGGVAGADAKCQQAGSEGSLSASLAPGASWKALLSSKTEGVNAADRLDIVEKVLTLKGIAVASGKADLFDGSISSKIAASTELGTDVSGDEVWTGSQTDGKHQGTANDCAGWTSVSTSADGMVGLTSSTNSAWIAYSNTTGSCANLRRLYCVSSLVDDSTDAPKVHTGVAPLQVCPTSGAACLGKYVSSAGTTRQDATFYYEKTTVSTGLGSVKVYGTCSNTLKLATTTGTSYYTGSDCQGSEYTSTSTSAYAYRASDGVICHATSSTSISVASTKTGAGCVNTTTSMSGYLVSGDVNQLYEVR